jgi:hypothetical protein
VSEYATVNSSTAQEKRVFLSGTDRAIDVLSVAADARDSNPSGSISPVFPSMTKTQRMPVCVEAVETCGRIVLVLDERAGLPHKPSLGL